MLQYGVNKCVFIRRLKLSLPRFGSLSDSNLQWLINGGRQGADALCVLDLTAAFDTVDHELLILRLERQFRLRGVVLEWFRSYVHDRTVQVVYHNGLFSARCCLCYKPRSSLTRPMCTESSSMRSLTTHNGMYCTLSSRRCTVCHDTTTTVHHGRRSVDGGEQI